MNRTINHFMWGYQPHFRTEISLTAEHVFERLDDRFHPEVFLVGVIADDESGSHVTCIEPENDHWLESEELEGAKKRSEVLQQAYPEANIIQSHPIAQEQHSTSLARRSIRDAVAEAIDSHPAKPKERTYFVSYPTRIAKYWVCVVLGLESEVIAAHPQLRNRFIKLHEYRTAEIPESLIVAAVEKVFEYANSEMSKPNPGHGFTTPDADEMLRSAGNALCMGVASRVDLNCIAGVHSLFRNCTTLSSLRYEKTAPTGTMILAKSDDPRVKSLVTFSQPTTLSDFKMARKRLQLAGIGVSLHCDPDRVYGIAVIEAYDGATEDLFEIRIVAHHDWELLHCGRPLMRVTYGQPRLPKPSINIDKLRNDLRRMFPEMNGTGENRILECVAAAQQSPHGALIVISEAAEVEADRLGNEATRITPCYPPPDVITKLASIDGALLLGVDGKCFAAGIILDGKASLYERPGRGSRYNSAIRYVSGLSSISFAIVLSEDGDVDFVPDLMPRIRRSEIEQRIVALRAMKDRSTIRRAAVSDAVEWLQQHKFYLSQSDCQTLNELVPTLEDRILREGAGFKIIHPEFHPDSRMNESFYAPEE